MKAKNLKRILFLLLCLLVVVCFCSALAFDIALTDHYCDHDDHCAQCVALHGLQKFFASLAFTAGAVSAFGWCHFLLRRILWRAQHTHNITPVALLVRLDI